jgi:hypothetical protein
MASSITLVIMLPITLFSACDPPSSLTVRTCQQEYYLKLAKLNLANDT